jgi:predicted dehydrogenase
MTGNRALRLGIVGLGKMGRLHLRTWGRIAGVEVTVVADRDPARRPGQGDPAVPFHLDPMALIGRVDAAIVATPADQHLACALPLLEAGVHCLVEKPLALTLADTVRLVEAARAQTVFLAVGQSERFNPGVEHARAGIDGGTRAIRVVRRALRSNSHGIETDVVQDLMVHDLDWVTHALGRMPSDLAVDRCVWQAGRLEAAVCRLSFAGGPEVVLETDRLADERQRTASLERAHGESLISLEPGRHPPPDPLTRQAHAFLAGIRRAPTAIATGAEALPLMALVERVRAAAAPGGAA